MTCDHIRRMLSLEPVGTLVPHSAVARRHLLACSDCRRFWQALVEVDAALATRPLALPETPLAVSRVPAEGERTAQATGRPFSRLAWLFGITTALCALAAGAYALQRAAVQSAAFSVASGQALPSPWPNAASRWLSAQSDRLAQVVLAVMMGMLVTLVSAAVGFQASARSAPVAPPSERPQPPRA
jgi:predicted anti-sigma-YlaC factor YlaD